MKGDWAAWFRPWLRQAFGYPIDPDWRKAYAKAFRAGFRAGVEAAKAEYEKALAEAKAAWAGNDGERG